MSAELHRQLEEWFAAHSRDLPWRSDDCSPWGVLVSEVMLQQTPVVRVLPVWQEWMRRWPTPAHLARDSSGEAVRAWGRLGYPRRALRLHGAAVAIEDTHGGCVPDDPTTLRSLPGIGDYTAAAVAAFAFGRRAVVLDTNIRRVLLRLVAGQSHPGAAPTQAERRRAEDLLPVGAASSARWNAAVMELGALICTARSPACDECPVRDSCAWREAGYPQADTPRARTQAWEGTDRQCRGSIMQVLRAHDGALDSPDSVGVPRADLIGHWPDADQADRALTSLLVDGLAERHPRGGYQLPH